MSEQSQGPGWWQASDGKWYPPQDAAPAPPVPPMPPAAAEGGGQQPPAPGAGETPGGEGPGGGSRKGLFIGLGILVVILLIAAAALVFGGGGDGDDDVANDPDSSVPEGEDDDGEDDDGEDQEEDPDDGESDISDEMPSDDITLADDVVVVDSEGGDLFGGYSDDGEALLIDSSADGLDELDEGEVLLLSGITVVRVAQIDEVDDGVIVTGEPVSLPEVIVEGDLEWEDVEFDPDQMRLFVYEDSTPGGSQANNLAVPSSYTGDPGGVVATPASFALPAKTVSGKVGDFSFDLSHEGVDGGHHLVLDVKSTGDMVGTVNIDVKMGSLATSGKIQIAGETVQVMDYGFGEFGGDATITTDLRATKNTTSIMSKPFLKVPFGIEFPALVGGIPFTLSIKSTIQVQLSMALAGASLGGKAEISFGGDAGFHFKGGELTVSGNRIQDAPDLINTIKGMATGPVGVVVTSELPKVGFGFGFLQTGAGVFISSGMVVQQSILPPPPACTGSQIAYVLAAGVEASFLGKSIDLGRKAIVDERWDYTVPKTEQCMPEMR